MKEKQIGSGMGAGGISILAIFVVLCLATLAALSLVSARADRNLAEKTLRPPWNIIRRMPGRRKFCMNC